MTELKVGDRVKVEFESVVTYVYSSETMIELEYPGDEDVLTVVPLSSITKIAPQLPTAIGSVIRITYWYGPEDWTAILRIDGNWHLSHGSTRAFFEPDDLLLHNPTWEAIYVPGVTK